MISYEIVINHTKSYELVINHTKEKFKAKAKTKYQKIRIKNKLT